MDQAIAAGRLLQTERTTLHRRPGRGSYDRGLVHAILDEGLVLHLGLVLEGRPCVIPTTYARLGEQLYLHGATTNRALGALAAGGEACAVVTLLDGLVLARSAMHHSMNYRSVVLHGAGRRVDEAAEKQAALAAILEHVVPGRAAEVRPPSRAELDATLVVALPIDEGSAKVRSGPPVDLASDLDLPCWAGELPLRLTAGGAVADAHVPAGVGPPIHVTGWRRR